MLIDVLQMMQIECDILPSCHMCNVYNYMYEYNALNIISKVEIIIRPRNE